MQASRREFLVRTTGAAAAAVLPASVLSQAQRLSAAPSGKEPDPIRLGLVTYLWGKNWDLPTLITNCEKSEILAVELRTTHAHGVEPSLSAAERRTVRRRFEDSPVELLGPGSNECFDHLDPDALRAAIRKTEEFIKLSQDVGGSGVKVKPNSFHKEVPRERTIEQIGKSLNRVGAFAKEHGQEIRLEVHGQCAPLPTMRAILDVADHPSVRVCWNSNAEDLAGEGLEHNFGLVAGRFGRTAHVRDLDRDRYPYPTLFDLFVSIGYHGWLCLECSGSPPDAHAALVEQRRAFERLLTAARAKAASKGSK